MRKKLYDWEQRKRLEAERIRIEKEAHDKIMRIGVNGTY